MTDEQMRVAIAEASGWVARPPCFDGKIRFYENNNYPHPPRLRTVDELPDYPNDLNAMHEAEKTLAPIKVKRYISELWAAMCKDGKAEQLDIGTIHATAHQRAEAFLRTVGKWKEDA